MLIEPGQLGIRMHPVGLLHLSRARTAAKWGVDLQACRSFHWFSQVSITFLLVVHNTQPDAKKQSAHPSLNRLHILFSGVKLSHEKVKNIFFVDKCKKDLGGREGRARMRLSGMKKEGKKADGKCIFLHFLLRGQQSPFMLHVPTFPLAKCCSMEC